MINVPQQSPLPPPSVGAVETIYLVFKWHNTSVFVFSPGRGMLPTRSHRYESNTLPMIGHDIALAVIDPLTAISLGLVTADELGFPEAVKALFHLLNNGPAP